MSIVRAVLRNYPIARPFGIEVGVHGTLVAFAGLLVLLDAVSGGLFAGLFTIALVVALFGSVALHELGHALAARSYGVRTRAITLLPIGGIAMLESELRRPRHELVVALAGPAVNVAIAAALALLDRLLGGLYGQLPVLAGVHLGQAAHAFLAWVFDMNVMLAAFNMIPAFPMDGGRVLRAALAQRIGRLKATRIAARLGTVIAVLLGFAGLMGGFGSPMVVLVALFVYFAAKTELRRVEAEHAASAGPWGDQGGWFLYRGPDGYHAIHPGRGRVIDVPPGFFRVVERPAEPR